MQRYFETFNLVCSNISIADTFIYMIQHSRGAQNIAIYLTKLDQCTNQCSHFSNRGPFTYTFINTYLDTFAAMLFADKPIPSKCKSLCHQMRMQTSLIVWCKSAKEKVMKVDPNG